MSNGKPIQVTVSLDNLEEVTCPACQGSIFSAGQNLYRRLPVIQSPTGKPALVRIDLTACKTCGALYQIKGDELILVAQEIH